VINITGNVLIAAFVTPLPVVVVTEQTIGICREVVANEKNRFQMLERQRQFYAYDPYDDPELKKYQEPDAQGYIRQDISFEDIRRNAQKVIMKGNNAKEDSRVQIVELKKQKDKSKTLSNKYNMDELALYFEKTFGKEGKETFDRKRTKRVYAGGMNYNSKEKNMTKEERIIATIDSLIEDEVGKIRDINEQQGSLQELQVFMTNYNSKIPFNSAMAMYRVYLEIVGELSEQVKINRKTDVITYLNPKELIEKNMFILDKMSEYFKLYWDDYKYSEKAQDKINLIKWALKQKETVMPQSESEKDDDVASEEEDGDAF
jgi:hypothetical protein